MLVSEWAERRQLWSRDFAPYQAGVLDAAAEPDVHTIVIYSDFQRGKTTLLLTIAAWFAQHEAAPVCYVSPSSRDSHHLRRERAGALQHDPLMFFAGSDRGWHFQQSFRAVLFDEIGRFAKHPVGDYEGDALSYLVARTATWAGRLAVFAGSDRASRTAFERSDARCWDGQCWTSSARSPGIAGFDLRGLLTQPRWELL